MRKKNLLWVIVGLIAIGISAACFFLPAKSGDPEPQGAPTTVKTKARPKAKPSSTRNSARRMRLRESEKTLDVMDDDDEDLKDLSPEMRKLMVELQAALDADDFKTVSKICEKILRIQRTQGEGAVPKEVREKAVEALGLFLPESLAELVGFMADSDPEVLEAVLDQLDTILNDTTIGDKDLSPLLTNMAKVLRDEDALDSLTMAIESDMRNSIKVATYKEILKTGSASAKARIRESIAECMDKEPEELPKDDKSIMKELDNWLEENPDDEDDDDFYAGV